MYEATTRRQKPSLAPFLIDYKPLVTTNLDTKPSSSLLAFTTWLSSKTSLKSWKRAGIPVSTSTSSASTPQPPAPGPAFAGRRD
ncbi:hypothetical protein KFK09_016404 [Dendrobium nobile]|uniref:Uncharacterized protein n=1 Tax=Dendrobium nobile TaxID=94219 RepID=A0A8T3AYL8_DENNO|nr:hypothetical protein KFK09_016404 [Dendrobium nobile]